MAKGSVPVSEKDVQAACLEYLAARKAIFFFRLNNIPVQTKDGGYRSMGKYQPKGLPDCIVISKGDFVGLEFKGSKGVLSKEQTETHAKIWKAGGQVYVIRSIEDMQKLPI